MDRVLANYQTRLDSWRLDHFKGEFPGGNQGDLNLKFYPSGAAKPFYGLTVVAFIDPESTLHQKLCDFQSRIRTALELAGLDSIFSFLDPLSFHMTLCDIVASPMPIPRQRVENIIQTARDILPKLGKYSDLSCQLTGLGLDLSLLLLVQFKRDVSLENCLTLEKNLKVGLGVDERSFLGHVSLAYFVRSPGVALQRIKKVFAPFSRTVLGEFKISDISLCHFRDMNNYTPLMSLNMIDGRLNDYSDTIDLWP